MIGTAVTHEWFSHQAKMDETQLGSYAKYGSLQVVSANNAMATNGRFSTISISYHLTSQLSRMIAEDKSPCDNLWLFRIT